MDLQKEHNQYKIKIQNNLHFPIDSFPETTRYFIREIASSIGVDDSFPGTIILSVVSGLIGSSVKITVKDGYSEIAPIWTILISPSGNAKTPVFNTVLNPVEIIQSELDRKYDERFKKYSHKCILYDEKLRLWKKDFRNEIESEMPEEPSKPFRKRLLLNDASLCSIIESLENYPEGSLLYQDELSGLLNSFKNSSNGRDNLPKYLSLFNGEVTRYARKGKEDLIIPRPTFTLTGTIQPKVLHEITRKNKRLENSGMLQRFLYCYSTSNPMRWTDKTISIDVKKEFEKMTRTIFDLRDHATRMNAPLELSLSPEAYKEWVEFCNLNAEKQEDTANDFVRSSLAKFQTHTARIALTLHVLKCVETKKDYSEWSLQVDSETMLDAIRLIDWFGGELHKVGSLLHGNSSSEDDLTELILEKISESTEGMKVRDLQRSTHRFKGERKAEELDRKLCEMVRNGMLSRQIQNNRSDF